MKSLFALLLALFTVVTTAAAVGEYENIYAAHRRTHKLISVRGRVFRAHGGTFYSQVKEGNRHIVHAMHIIPGRPDVATEQVAEIPSSETSTSVGNRLFPSHTGWWEWTEDGGNVYIYDEKNEDEATEVEVKNMPEGYGIRESAAVPHEGKLLLILEEEATRKRCFAFLDVASGMLDEKRYPGADDSSALIWRGGDLVWQITAGRMSTFFNIYDLKKEQYLMDDDAGAQRYSIIVPMNRVLIGIKGNGDIDTITPLDPPQIAADAPAPSDTILYGIPEQPGDTILCTPGKVYAAGENAFYRIKQNYVNKMTICAKDHMMETTVFDMTGYTNANPGQNPIISHRYTGEIDLHGGDIILMPEGAAPTPLRVKNLPSGYVIDACAATPCEGKLALHLTHAAEGKCAYALMDTATAAIEGPLHPAPVSQPASLIQRNAHIIWEITKANAWEIPLTAYDLRTDRRVFETRIDTPKGICILGNTAAELSLGDLLYRLYTLQDIAPMCDTIYAVWNGIIRQQPGKAFLADGKRIYLAEKLHYEKSSLSNAPTKPRIVSISVQPYTIQNDRLAKDGEPICVPVTPYITAATDEDSSERLERTLLHQQCGDVYITPMTMGYYAPRLSIRNMPEDCVVEKCSPAPVDGYIIALLANTKTQERFYAKLDVRSGMIDGEPIPGAESCGSRLIIWRGGDTIHEISEPPFGLYRTFSLSQKAYTSPLLKLKGTKQSLLLHGNRLWEVSMPQ